MGHIAVECWSKDLDCRKCGKWGHAECKGAIGKNTKQDPQTSKHAFKKKDVHKVEQLCWRNSSADDQGVHILSVAGGSQGYWVSSLVEGQLTHMKIDTGAAVSTVSDSVYKKALQHLSIKKIQYQLEDLHRWTYTSQRHSSIGQIKQAIKQSSSYIASLYSER